MATDKFTNPGLRLPWAGKQVRPEQVEDELTTLWHLAADNMRISQNTNVRTSVLNFVICASNTESAHKASMLLRALSSTHIARVILLILDQQSDLPTGISAWITLRSFPVVSDLMRHHFEQITVTLTGEALHSSANIVLSLLKPDLPVYLWWLNDLPQDTSLFSHLLAISNRIILDSNSFSAPEEIIHTLSPLLQEEHTWGISDLTWSRVTPWRELIAQFFDVAQYRSYLINVNQIEIEHTVSAVTHTTYTPGVFTSPNPLRALLLAAWLKTRLGWKISSQAHHTTSDPNTGTYTWHMTERHPVTSGSLHLNTQPGGMTNSTITISIRPQEQATSIPGTICLVRLTSVNDGVPAVFTIKREGDDDHVLTSVELPDNSRLQRTVNITATHKEEDLMHNELEIMGRDHLYEDTLHEVFALLTR